MFFRRFFMKNNLAVALTDYPVTLSIRIADSTRARTSFLWIFLLIFFRVNTRAMTRVGTRCGTCGSSPGYRRRDTLLTHITPVFTKQSLWLPAESEVHRLPL